MTIIITKTCPDNGRVEVKNLGPWGSGVLSVTHWLVDTTSGISRPLISPECVVCGADLTNDANTVDAMRVGVDSRFGYELTCGPRTPHACHEVPDMAYLDPYGVIERDQVDDEAEFERIIKRGTSTRSVEAQGRYDRGRKPRGKRHYRKAGA